MILSSELSKRAYLSALKEAMSPHTDFGVERFTGFFLGSCFYVTHHADFEWNRKYTNQKNAAIGYVKQTENGCEVRFLRFRGMLCPMIFLPYFLILEAIAVMYFLSGQAAQDGIVAPVLYPLVIVALPLIETFFESLTEESETGRRMLLSLLCNPSDPYDNFPDIP